MLILSTTQITRPKVFWLMTSPYILTPPIHSCWAKAAGNPHGSHPKSSLLGERPIGARKHHGRTKTGQAGPSHPRGNHVNDHECDLHLRGPRTAGSPPISPSHSQRRIKRAGKPPLDRTLQGTHAGSHSSVGLHTDMFRSMPTKTCDVRSPRYALRRGRRQGGGPSSPSTGAKHPEGLRLQPGRVEGRRPAGLGSDRCNTWLWGVWSSEDSVGLWC